MLTEAIILAGGKGTRLRSEVSDVPKPMAKIGDKPFLEILIESFYKKGIRRFVLSVGYMFEVITDHFFSKYDDIDLIFVLEPMPLGTGGAIKLALDYIQSDKALVLNGDTLFDVDLKQLISFLSDKRSSVIFTRDTDDISRYGVFIHEKGKILGYKEKGRTGRGCINGGIYLLRKNILDKFDYNKKFSFEEEFLTELDTSDDFHLIISDGYFIDIGVPEDYLRAQKELPEI